ncbi:hypothetical protein D3C86_1907060 [compost metagenome]
MRIRIFFIDVISVISGNNFYLMLLGKGDQGNIDNVFIFLIMPHQLDIKIVAEL